MSIVNAQSVYRKILSNEQIINELLITLFPQKKTLKLLRNYFLDKRKTIYLNLAQIISEKLNL